MKMLLIEDFNLEYSFKRYIQKENTINNNKKSTRQMKGHQVVFSVCMSMEKMQSDMK